MKWLKWYTIIVLSIITRDSVVDFMGHTYVVSGNIVKKIR